MNLKRKYRFNWLDHLYFMGKGSWRVPLRAWPTPFEALGLSVVGVPLTFHHFMLQNISSDSPDVVGKH